MNLFGGNPPYRTLHLLQEARGYLHVCPFYNLSSGLTAPSGPPRVIKRVIIPTSRSLHLGWEEPVEAAQNGVILGYVVRVERNYSEEVQSLNTTLTSVVVGELQPHRSYWYSIAAYTSGSLGPFSGTLLIQTLEEGKWVCILKLCSFLSTNMNTQLELYSS